MSQEFDTREDPDRRLIWLDLEMTGLDPNNDSIFASMQSLADYIGARQAANS